MGSVRGRRGRRTLRPVRGAAVALVAVGLVAASGCSSSDEPSAQTSSTTSPPSTAAVEDGGPVGAAVIAHRGASAYAPEHTFAAYDLALEQGADYLEQDVQLTADGELVVLHDGTLDRTVRGPAASCSGPVGERTLAEVQACDAGSAFDEANPDLADPAHAAGRVPALAEVLDRYGADARYYIEVKSPAEQPGIEEALLAVLDDAELAAPTEARPPVYIQSFSGDSLRAIHERRPDLPLVRLLPAEVGEVTPEMLDDIATYASVVAPAARLVDADLVAAAHERCLAVHPWTVDDPDEIRRLLDAGVDGIFTNVPDVLAAEVEGRDAPPERCTS